MPRTPARIEARARRPPIEASAAERRLYHAAFFALSVAVNDAGFRVLCAQRKAPSDAAAARDGARDRRADR